MLYFAYGSNLNHFQMKRRCKDSIYLKKINLKDFRLTFRSKYRAADIEPKKNSIVPGGLFEISKNDEKKLDLYEDFPILYKKFYFEYYGKKVMTYTMVRKTPFKFPTERYLNVVKRGYSDCKLDFKYLKKGLIYENQYNNKPQFFRGETGAQSSIIPFLDGALGIGHTNDNLKHYLNEMRDYMPPKHRRMIEKVENKSQAKEIILKSKLLTKEYNHCVEEIRKFRAQHLEYAATYIHKQAQVKSDVGTGGSVVRGTGGTPFMKYLKKHRDETANQKI